MKMIKVPVYVGQWHIAHVAAENLEQARELAETANSEQLIPIGEKTLKAADYETTLQYNPNLKEDES